MHEKCKLFKTIKSNITIESLFILWQKLTFLVEVVELFFKLKNELWVHISSVAQSCLTLCDSMNCSTPGLPVHHQLPKSTQTNVHWVGDAIQPCNPLSPLLLLPSIFPSIRVFSKDWSLHIRWPKYWSFRFNISPSRNTQDWSPLGWTGWISMQSKGLSRVFLQHHSSKESILWCLAFFIVHTWLLEKP